MLVPVYRPRLQVLMCPVIVQSSLVSDSSVAMQLSMCDDGGPGFISAAFKTGIASMRRSLVAEAKVYRCVVVQRLFFGNEAACPCETERSTVAR